MPVFQRVFHQSALITGVDTHTLYRYIRNVDGRKAQLLPSC